MWRIRSEQVEGMRQSSLKTFEDYMVEHLHGFIPKLAAVLGEEGLRKVIRYGLKRAEPYGFTSGTCVRFFIEMIFLFGAEFDTDPQYPWAKSILTEEGSADQTVRGDRLFDQAKDFLDKVSGPERKFVRDALRRARQEPFEGPPMDRPEFAQQTKERFHRVYPEKCKYIGEEALDRLLRRGVEETHKNGVTTGAGAALFVGLMFTLGHGMARDPHVPWVGGTLGNKAIADPNKRAERLYSKAMTYLDEILNSLD